MQTMAMHVIETNGFTYENDDGDEVVEDPVVWQVPDIDAALAGDINYGKHWVPLLKFSQEFIQEYSGSGSANIRTHTGRVQLPDVTVEKFTDEMSPRIFECCCTGKAVDTVVIEWRVSSNNDLVMQLVLDGGVNFSNYKMQHTTPPLMTYEPNESDIQRRKQSTPRDDVKPKETFTMAYTRVRMKFGDTCKGWSGLYNCPDNTEIEEPTNNTDWRRYQGQPH